jgi:hypothetical protein
MSGPTSARPYEPPPRAFIVCAFAVAVTAVVVVHAGQLYGSIVFKGTGVVGAAVEIDCGGTVTRGTTAAGGAYRIDVRPEGQCSLTLPVWGGHPSAIVFSNPNPAAFNFELVEVSSGQFELRRR